MPSLQAIQSVLNFMWGKGQKLDIKLNKEERSVTVRIPNEYIRSKALEKRIWYVGSSMFHVLPLTSKHEASTPDMESIPLWAHLIGLPLNLRSLEGLSFAAGLIGEPKETDEYISNQSRHPDQTDLAIPSSSDFESDLQEILSSSPSKPITDSAMTDLIIYSPGSSSELTSPHPTIPPVIFSSLPAESQFVVALAANPPFKRRNTPFKHTSSRKKPTLPSPLSITTLNPFSALDLPDPIPLCSGSSVRDIQDPSAPLSSATPFEGPLLLQGVSAPSSL
ncbi:hypothetical protein YC2023_095276 [Brassica napus]